VCVCVCVICLRVFFSFFYVCLCPIYTFKTLIIMNIAPFNDTSKPYKSLILKPVGYCLYNQVKHSKVPSPASTLQLSD